MNSSSPAAVGDAPEGELRGLLPPKELRPRIAVLAALVLGTYAFFVGAPAWNQNSRFALTRAMVERQATWIDPDHPTTGDKSYRDGHFYSDKAPGVSMLAVVPYAVARLALGAAGRPPEVSVEPLDPMAAQTERAPSLEERAPGDRIVFSPSYRFALWLCRLFAVSVPSVLALYALGAIVRRYSGQRQAEFTALVYGLATPAFVYAAAFYGHQACAAFLVISLALILHARPENKTLPVLAGLSAGLAVLCEYPAAVVAVLLVAFAAHNRGVAFAIRVAAGGAVIAVVLAGYHTVAFGSPLKTGYDFVYLEEFAEGMAVRYGINAPNPRVMGEILFGSYRGLFYLSPVLLLAAWGLVVLAARPNALDSARDSATELRRVVILALIVCLYYVVLNAGYYMWDGGAALGPRHCVPMLGLLALGLPAARAAAPKATMTLAIVSGAMMLIAVSAAPEMPQHGNPLWGHALTALAQGEAGVSGPTNLGRVLGLPGAWSLLPLLALWVLGWPRRSSTER